METIRDYAASDLAAITGIALRTGADGADASAMFRSPDLLGLVYAVPYVTFQPELALVVEDGDGVAGYCVGALDTSSFEGLLSREWWPPLRKRFPSVRTGERRTTHPDDADLTALIHDPPHAPGWLVEHHPSHLHINLLPRLQGRGLGASLLGEWHARVRTLGSIGFHLGVGRTNHRAMRFYERSGMTRLQPPDADEQSGAIWFGMRDPPES
jgi:ribosomal protein S18 acetylase RimI-like enzyme